MEVIKIKIGKFSIGTRVNNRNKFYLKPYCPLLKENRESCFYFFWWIGNKYYVALSK